MQTPEPTAAAGQPATRTRRHQINAGHLKLALAAGKLRPGTRWAAMSNGAATAQCTRRQPGGGYWMHTPPLMQPLTAGRMQCVLDRARSHGLAEVLRTWRTSIAVLKVEFSTCVLRQLPRAA